MPINKLSLGIKNIPSYLSKHINNLKFRNTILVFIEVDAKNLFDDNWLYIHSPEVKLVGLLTFVIGYLKLTKIKKQRFCL